MPKIKSIQIKAFIIILYIIFYVVYKHCNLLICVFFFFFVFFFFLFAELVSQNISYFFVSFEFSSPPSVVLLLPSAALNSLMVIAPSLFVSK